MKADATLEDFKNREKFLIRYIESQIEKKSHGFADGAKELFLGIYDNTKLLNKAIRELRLFIAKNI